MKILFVSGELTGSGLVQKLISEGNEVRLYIHRSHWKDCYSGIAEKVDNWETNLDWVGKEGLIVFDDVIFGPEQDKLRALGYKVIGGSSEGNRLESERGYFQKLAEQLGIEALPFFDFDKVDDAIAFVKNNPGRWVVKQNSHQSFQNYIGQQHGGADVLRVLEKYKKRKIAPVHLQKYVSGVEVGVARYFNGNDWVGPVEINHEHKNLNEGNVGPLTPEMGTVLWYTDTEVPLFTETLSKFKPYLQKINFKGDFDINFIVDEKAIWPIEATPRFGAPSTQIQVALHKSPWTDFLSAVAKGESYNLDYHHGYGIAVSLVVPPFPYEPEETETLRALEERIISLSDTLTKSDLEHIHFEEVSKSDSQHFWSGNHGLVLHVTAHAETIQQARKEVYERIHKIKFKGMYYRKDIGDKVDQHDIAKLKEWGWI